MGGAWGGGGGGSDTLRHPLWIPEDCGAATLDIIGSTVSSVALPPTGTGITSMCEWYGEEGTAPTAVRFIQSVLANVTDFRIAIYDDEGSCNLMYATANESAAVNSATGEQTFALAAQPGAHPIAPGDKLHVWWWNSGVTGATLQRTFAPPSALIGNMDFGSPHGRSMSNAGETGPPATLQFYGQSTIVWYGQVLK